MKKRMSKQEYEDLAKRVYKAAALVKLVCGAGNNAAHGVMQDAMDHAKQCSRFNMSIKGGHRISYLFRKAFKLWDEYESNLLYTSKNRMFHMADMSPEVRRRYGDITDEQYYEFWAGVGHSAYGKTRPLMTSLWNKYRLSLEHHGVKDAEHVAWVLTAAASLNLAVQLYQRAINQCETEMRVPRYILTSVFGQFDLTPVLKAWRTAVLALAPDSEYPLESTERKNIEFGLTQLCDAWIDPTTLYTSTMQSVEDYEDVFATQGHKKKALKEIAEVQEATEREPQKTEQ